MDQLVLGLGPAFAAGFAVQQLLEFLSPFVHHHKYKKKLLMGCCSVTIGMILSFGAGLRVLGPLGNINAGIFDPIVTGLIISAGTEGVNSVLKFLSFAKDAKAQVAGVK
jgi:hypothetical protein